jgi:putative transposase
VAAVRRTLERAHGGGAQCTVHAWFHGYNAGKRVKGRKRHLVVDSLGLLLAAGVQDRDGAHPVMAQAMAKCPSVQTLFVDGGYAGHCAQTVSQLQDIHVQVVRHPANKNLGCWTHL